MKLHSALIVVERPPGNKFASDQGWLSFRDSMPNILKTAKGVESFGENTFLMSLENGMSDLTQILSNATRYGLKYRVLFLDAEQQWVYSDPHTP